MWLPYVAIVLLLVPTSVYAHRLDQVRASIVLDAQAHTESRHVRAGLRPDAKNNFGKEKVDANSTLLAAECLSKKESFGTNGSLEGCKGASGSSHGCEGDTSHEQFVGNATLDVGHPSSAQIAPEPVQSVWAALDTGLAGSDKFKNDQPDSSWLLYHMSDTHGAHEFIEEYFGELPKAKYYVHTGDFTQNFIGEKMSVGNYLKPGDPEEHRGNATLFSQWLQRLHRRGKFEKFLLIPGNHDSRIWRDAENRRLHYEAVLKKGWKGFYKDYYAKMFQGCEHFLIHLCDEEWVSPEGVKFYGICWKGWWEDVLAEDKKPEGTFKNDFFPGNPGANQKRFVSANGQDLLDEFLSYFSNKSGTQQQLDHFYGFENIPNDVDILLSHFPLQTHIPKTGGVDKAGILSGSLEFTWDYDRSKGPRELTQLGLKPRESDSRVPAYGGSYQLYKRIALEQALRPQVYLCGHVHVGRGAFSKVVQEGADGSRKLVYVGGIDFETRIGRPFCPKPQSKHWISSFGGEHPIFHYNKFVREDPGNSSSKWIRKPTFLRWTRDFTTEAPDADLLPMQLIVNSAQCSDNADEESYEQENLPKLEQLNRGEAAGLPEQDLKKLLPKDYLSAASKKLIAPGRLIQAVPIPEDKRRVWYGTNDGRADRKYHYEIVLQDGLRDPNPAIM